jgi:nitric oxide reductase NorQ protein
MQVTAMGAIKMDKIYRALLLKTDNGFNARFVATEGGPTEQHILVGVYKGANIMNRNFKQVAVGYHFVASFTISVGGRRFFKEVINMDLAETDEWLKVESEQEAPSYNLEVAAEPDIEEVPAPVNKAEVLRGHYISPEARLAFTTIYKMSQAKPERAVNLLMEGPSGYGKTTLPRLFAAMVGKNFLRYNCATVRDPEEWFGHREARAGSTIFIRSRFAHAIEKGNLVLVLDEFNRLEPWLHNTLYPLLDDDGKTVVHEEEFKIGPGVIVVATINSGYRYTGTFELDQALSNRFPIVLEVGAMPSVEEEHVLVERVGVSSKEALQIVKMANILRQSNIICSTRTSLWTAEFVRAGMTIREALEYTVVRRIPVDSGGVGLRKQAIDLINPQQGVFTVKAPKDDVFADPAAPQPVQEELFQVPEDIVGPSPRFILRKHPSKPLAKVNVMRLIRSLPLLAGVDMKGAESLAEQIERGDDIILPLASKPEELRKLVTELSNSGVSGVYTDAAE